MTRPSDSRGANRRGATAWGEDIGLDVAFDHVGQQPQRKTYYPPSTPQGINAAIHQRATTGRCVVCGQPANGGGVTCLSKRCIRGWVFGV